MIQGKICDSRSRVNVEWKIPEYFSLVHKADTFYDSPSFSFLDATWNLKISPNGERKNGSVGFVNLYLQLQNATALNKVVTVTLGIKHRDGTLIKGPSNLVFDKLNSIYGCNEVCLKVHLHQQEHSYVPKGVLTVICEGTASPVTDATSQTSPESTTLLSRDFYDLLKSERESDVTIQVQERFFRVHKLILESRSPVFAAMFEHDMAEKNEGIVKVVDCDPDTFQKFLEYIYAGKLENLSWDNVIGLFATADKYCVTELREQCAEFMRVDLSVDTVCDILLAADRHNEIELKKSAEKLLVENIKAVLHTDKWKKLLIENYSLGAEILMDVIPGDRGLTKMKKTKSLSHLIF